MVSKEKIIEILNANIENVAISVEQFEDDLLTLGMDSIAFISVIVSLEEEFELEIPDEKLLLTEMNTPSKIMDVIYSILKSSYEVNE